VAACDTMVADPYKTPTSKTNRIQFTQSEITSHPTSRRRRRGPNRLEDNLLQRGGQISFGTRSGDGET